MASTPFTQELSISSRCKLSTLFGVLEDLKYLRATSQSKGLLPFQLKMASYQIYRNTTLGTTLVESLDEMIQYNQIPASLASKILLQFDRSMSIALANRVKSRVTFKASKLGMYRFCDNVWTWILNDVEFREVAEIAKVDKVKIVATDGKGGATTLPSRDD